ncbi:hypothetical protein PNOK_0803500 [Pyrrhoderma noxium]|uniref:Fungal-type protein kinase domain-containing protein n=1 Tax=Pyrrhoderma noxium TaxID=2282107 RepID=A0A286UA30_9AGAM|nr:hypothetical protein PNOK_0803500 [Pyrrhoderma noxium]
MGDKVDTKDQFLDNPQDGQKKLSHSSLRPQDNLADGSLEPVSSSQLHPHSESGTLLGRQRDRIIKDLGSSVSRGSLEYFKKILPPIRPEFDINKISSHLIKNGDLVQEEGIYVWNEFRSATIVTTEMQSFNRTLVNVLNAICDAALETSGIRVAPIVEILLISELLYDIEVGGEYYHTSESNLVFDEKADDLMTSATRIWKAKRDTGGADVVIKDFWPDDERETEDNIRRMILKDIKDPKKRKFFKKHTLNPISAGRVKCNGKDDHTKDTILRGRSPDTTESHKIPTSSCLSLSKSKGGNSTTPGVATEMKDDTQLLSRELERNQPTKYHHRYHYRIAYKEVTVPYYKLRKTNAMIKVIIDAVKTLLYLHEAGWVHRDISVGNLYPYTDPVSGEKRGLIGDLEYAKGVGDGGKPDACTGTPDFTAIEVAFQMYQFLKQYQPKREQEGGGPYSGEEDDSSDDDSSDDSGDGDSSDDTSEDDDSEDDDNEDADGEDDDGEDDDGEDGDTESLRKPGINHNYIHDLESLWWILVRTVFVYEKAPALTDETSARRCGRSRFLRDVNVFKSYMKKAPPFFKGYVRMIERFRILLLYEYNEVEKDVPAPIYFSIPNTIHKEFLKELLKEKTKKGSAVSAWDRAPL